MPSFPSNIFQSPPCASLTPRPTVAKLRRAKLLFVWLHQEDEDDDDGEVEEVLRRLDSTVTRCPLDLSPGLYDPDNVFVFLFSSGGGGGSSRRATRWGKLERMFNATEIRRHAKVAAFSPPPRVAREATKTLIVTRFNFYQVKYAPMMRLRLYCF